jgi:glutathione S-transferase
MTMNLVLHQHPFASYCQKVVIALYELELPFSSHQVDGVEGREALARLWPMASIPVLRDEDAGLTLPESTTIVEHLDVLAGGGRLIPGNPAGALQARLWDRFADGHLSTPMQTIVGDRLRPDDAKDPHGVAQARAELDLAYGVLDDRLAERPWAAGESFTLADCATAPPLFYLRAIHRWDEAAHAHITRYYRELMARPSVRRTIDEARPLRPLFPLPWPDDQDALDPA